MDLSQRVSKAVGFKLVPHYITGDQFEKDQIEQEINEVKFSPADIAILYVNTHGGNRKEDNVNFPIIQVKDIYMSSFGMHRALAEKRPKTLITVIEACNGYRKATDKQIRFLLRQSIPDKHFDPNAIGGVYESIKKLFNNGCRLIVTAGQPGMDTWSTNEGSIFSNNLIRSFNECVADQKNLPTWTTILNNSKSYTSSETLGTRLEHYPVWSPPKCNILVSQSIEDDSLEVFVEPPVKEQLIEIDPSLLKRKHLLGPKDYRDFELTIPDTTGIDSVTYFLHHTFNDSIVTSPFKNTNFYYKLRNVYGGFKMKYWVHYRDGRRKELWDEVIFYKHDGVAHKEDAIKEMK